MRGGWFRGAGLGLFVHWGPYAASGWDASWGLVGGVATLPLVRDVPIADYYAAARSWRPAPGAADGWARAARAAGARYAVLTAKHHDGIALWPSNAPGAFSVASLGVDRDLVAEFVAACRRERLRVGLYVSLSDWLHPDYPPFTQALKPYRFGRYPQPTPEQWARFRAYLKAQLSELLTGYGPIDCLWFDGGWERPADVWDVADLEAHIRRLQPDVLINDRLPGRGDYQTPEQFVPAEAPAGLWEACLTMNRSWGFNAADHDYKTATALIHALAETAAKGGNLLLNVGPDGPGVIVPPQRARLESIATWMDRHAEAIHDAAPGLKPWQFYGPSTRKGATVYAILTLRPNGPVAVRGLPVKALRRVRQVGGGPLAFQTRMSVVDELFNPDPRGEVLIDLPDALVDPHATVMALEFDPAAEGALA